MGRYYNGDIEGKFWVAVQPSDAAARFGGRNYEPSYICLLYTSPSPRDLSTSRMPSSA